MTNTATVKIFLVEGDPDLIRTAEISNWTGKAVAGPRSKLEMILKRDEASKPGLYFLSGINPETGKERVYIGEGEIIRSRVKAHLDRDYWNTIIFFVSKDENLTKAHIKYLEGKLIEMTRAASRFEIDNLNTSGSPLPESDAADMNVFLGMIEQLLPVLGQNFLKPIAEPTLRTTKAELLSCEIKGVKATGRLSDNGFLVMQGSQAVADERPSVKKYPYPSRLREQLVAEGVLVPEQDRLVFVRDYEFSSPSAAASVIQGGHANGLQAWKDARGVSLKEREERQVSNHVAEPAN